MELQRSEHGKLGDVVLQRCIEEAQSAVGSLIAEIGIRTGDPYLLNKGSLDVDPPDGSYYDGCELSHELSTGSDPAFDWVSGRIALANIQGTINELVVSF
ncbi:hypothetical protein CMQ_717 [Grosmannia clavigera kw1407]|uniref:Uncharacterized protein n=1 Tax=Grosmannia clavigera (strain kw1407 / UAMH 11150) TaxID=655863 RepID=F0XD71_GROCL|nr:uncharacterized protein CMQ_717 [Grosmannia clavigera kw1407]EFX03789.1 hypothetical protein CMQ_717 [Grosmannia clavigera kw1407]